MKMHTQTKIKILSVWVLKWYEDRWNSIILQGTWKAHPDKLGHFVAHVFITWFWLFVTHSWVALLIDFWINMQIEVMDGTRPRRSLYHPDSEGHIVFANQEDYEEQTIEGFSLKDLIAGFVGSIISYLIF